MKIIISDEEVAKSKIPALPLPSFDITGQVISPPSFQRDPAKGKISDLTKEIIALDAIDTSLTVRETGRLHDVSKSNTDVIQNGNHANEELKLKVADKRYKIGDTATTKLMQTLDLFRPDSLEQKELPGAALKIANVLDKVINPGAESGNKNNIIFNVYAPRQRSEDSYEVIEVKE